MTNKTLALLSNDGWKATMIEDFVLMFQKDGVTLMVSSLMDQDFPCHVESDGEILARFRDVARAVLFAVAEHTCKMRARRGLPN